MVFYLKMIKIHSKKFERAMGKVTQLKIYV